jgi:hypothetical protein
MTSTVLPPPPASPDRRRPRVRFSENPETRSVQIGLLGTILLHGLLLLLAPFFFRFVPTRTLRTPPPPQEFNIELTQDDPAKEAPKPPPSRFVETNPDAPENVPDKTNNFGAQNQQVAQEKPTPDGKNDRPALEGKKDLESSPIVSGQLVQQLEQTPSPPAPETPPQEQTVATPRLEQNPLSGSEKLEGDDKVAIGTNVAKASDRPESVPEKVAGVKDVPFFPGATTTQPQIDPQRPRPRPSIVAQQRARPAIFAENKFGTSNIGPIAFDARWSNYGAYLQRLIETVQIQWEHILSESRVYPTPGSTVEVKFILNSEGAVARIVNVESTATDAASRACMSAITERSPYGKWTDDMLAVLGEQQELTFKFFYQ